MLGSPLVIIDDYTFYKRFQENLKNYLAMPNAAILRAVLCAGCRNGISNRIFEECKKYKIEKVVNGASYLELAPFKGFEMEKFGDGSEIRDLLNGLLENNDYLKKDNLETIIRDHFTCHERDLSCQTNEYAIDYIDFYNYFENNPKAVKETVTKKLGWRHPEGQTWHFDCIVEDYKQLIYYASYGYNELDFKYSTLVRYGMLSRDESINLLKAQHSVTYSKIKMLEKQLVDFGFDNEGINSFQYICRLFEMRLMDL